VTAVNLCFFLLTLAGFLLGAWHLCWARCDHNSSRGCWARRLGFGALLCLGGTGLVAAGLRSSWLVPLGLLAGWLIVVMLWESPEPGLNQK
jgi:hypothetical protein